LVVFAGASQFVALGLIAGQAGLLVVWLTTLIVNLRHVLYGAALLPRVAHLPTRWRWLLGSLITDEAFAVTTSYYSRHPEEPLGHWYFLGAALPVYLVWQASTLAGLLLGAAAPEFASLGLDFAIVVTFIAIAVPLLITMPRLAAAIVAGTGSYLLRAAPYNTGLL